MSDLCTFDHNTFVHGVCTVGCLLLEKMLSGELGSQEIFEEREQCCCSNRIQ